MKIKKTIWDSNYVDPDTGGLKPQQKVIVVDPPIEKKSKLAFEYLTFDNEIFVKVEDWLEELKQLGVQMINKDGLPNISIYRKHTHGFNFKLIDGIPHLRIIPGY